MTAYDNLVTHEIWRDRSARFTGLLHHVLVKSVMALCLTFALFLKIVDVKML